ncbi:hypothetical protein J4417_05275 [Candidatus Woesearchaeota archaeon]|nr:hypothetical protein [Candidatus Woesearchaeota archaeon]
MAGLVFLFSGKGNATTEDSISGEAFWSSGRFTGCVCDWTATLDEGDSLPDDQGNSFQLVYVDDTYAKLKVNEETGPKIKAGQGYKFADAKVSILNVLYQAYAGGKHQTGICVKYN